MAPTIPPATKAITIVARIINGRGKSGKERANQPLITQPARACPGRPTLKKPARLATANPRAIRIKGPIARKISPIPRTLPNAV